MIYTTFKNYYFSNSSCSHSLSPWLALDFRLDSVGLCWTLDRLFDERDPTLADLATVHAQEGMGFFQLLKYYKMIVAFCRICMYRYYVRYFEWLPGRLQGDILTLGPFGYVANALVSAAASVDELTLFAFLKPQGSIIELLDAGGVSSGK